MKFRRRVASSGDGKCFVSVVKKQQRRRKRRICAPGQPDSALQVYKTRRTDRLHCLVDVRFDAPAAATARASLTVLARRDSCKDQLILIKTYYALTACSYARPYKSLL